MSHAIDVTLMLFAAIGFAGAGIAMAVARAREIHEVETDLGMRAVAILLLMFGGACAFVAAGFSGLLAFGGVVAWFSYVTASHRLGVFRIVQLRPQAEIPVERRRIA